jgi:hypothetical protein
MLLLGERVSQRLSHENFLGLEVGRRARLGVLTPWYKSGRADPLMGVGGCLALPCAPDQALTLNPGWCASRFLA